MKEYLLNNRIFLILMLFLVVTGMYGGGAIYLLLPVALFLMKKKKMYEEILLGFVLFLMLSDNRQQLMSFAANTKNIYITLFALFIFLDRKEFSPINTLYQYFIPFFLVALYCIIDSETVSISFQKTLSYFFLLFSVPNYVQKILREKGEEFFRNLIFFITLLLIAGFILIFLRPDVVFMENRFSGLLGNPNGLALFCILFFLILSVILDLYPGLFTRNEKIFVYGCLALAIILSNSRSAIFSIIIFFLFKSVYRIAPFLGFIAFILVVLAYQYVTDNLVSIIYSLGLQEFFRVETLETGSGRLVAWSFAWNHVQENFFLGRGFNYTEYLFQQHFQYLSMLGHQGNAHNSFLTFWLDTGLIGLLLYIGALIGMFIRVAKKSLTAIPVLYTVLFYAFFESWLTASLNPYTIQLFVIVTIFMSDEIVQRKETAALPVH